ncbi:MAG: phage tail protein [Gammaproteobacteria bacterium]|nr:phage tail protein [Gammaproteobacteria bacterium]
MSSQSKDKTAPHRAADTLYQIVPSLYRYKDTGDLEKYFKGSGHLLDQLHATLEQRLADAFPDNPIDGSPACQEWLIPYFAELLDVRLVSPLAAGRRDEVAKAVRWRQGKGTLRVTEEIAESVGQFEVVIQEGWTRVAITPRLNLPLTPTKSYGYRENAPQTPPSIAARHPGLPAVTVDFRCPSGAVEADSYHPGAQQSRVDGDTHDWRQSSFHGAPCYPAHYEDRSLRTVDLRCADWRVGHYHPDTVLLYAVPSAGWFHPDARRVSWAADPGIAFLELIDVIEEGNLTIYRNKTCGTDNFVPVNISRVIKLGQVADGVGDADFHTWRFEGVNLLHTLEADSGRVELIDCAARKVEVHSIDYEQPVITAHSCLIKNIQAARGVTQLEYCTVLDTTLSEVVRASDCIFLGRIRKHHLPSAPPDSGCVRYSRVIKSQAQGGMRLSHVTRSRVEMFSLLFAERGCGVLHPATPQAVRHGAEDGGEMGAYHDFYLSLLAEAVVDKLQDYLPLGVQAVMIPDERMLAMPG